jgi:hypothetical protein
MVLIINHQTTVPPTYPRMIRPDRTPHLSRQSGRRVSRLTTTLLDRGRRGPKEHERHRSGDAEGERVCVFGALEFGGAVFCSKAASRFVPVFSRLSYHFACGFGVRRVIWGSILNSIVNIISLLAMFDLNDVAAENDSLSQLCGC